MASSTTKPIPNGYVMFAPMRNGQVVGLDGMDAPRPATVDPLKHAERYAAAFREVEELKERKRLDDASVSQKRMNAALRAVRDASPEIFIVRSDKLGLEEESLDIHKEADHPKIIAKALKAVTSGARAISDIQYDSVAVDAKEKSLLGDLAAKPSDAPERPNRDAFVSLLLSTGKLQYTFPSLKDGWKLPFLVAIETPVRTLASANSSTIASLVIVPAVMPAKRNSVNVQGGTAVAADVPQVTRWAAKTAVEIEKEAANARKSAKEKISGFLSAIWKSTGLSSTSVDLSDMDPFDMNAKLEAADTPSAVAKVVDEYFFTTLQKDPKKAREFLSKSMTKVEDFTGGASDAALTDEEKRALGEAVNKIGDCMIADYAFARGKILDAEGDDRKKMIETRLKEDGCALRLPRVKYSDLGVKGAEPFKDDYKPDYVNIYLPEEFAKTLREKLKNAANGLTLKPADELTSDEKDQLVKYMKIARALEPLQSKYILEARKLHSGKKGVKDAEAKGLGSAIAAMVEAKLRGQNRGTASAQPGFIKSRFGFNLFEGGAAEEEQQAVIERNMQLLAEARALLGGEGDEEDGDDDDYFAGGAGEEDDLQSILDELSTVVSQQQDVHRSVIF